LNKECRESCIKMSRHNPKTIYKNYKEKKHEGKCRKLEVRAEQLKGYHTPNTLFPGLEEQWYYSAIDRIKVMKDKRVTEILQELQTNVQCHPEFKERLNKQLKKSQKKTFNGTIEQCLGKIMKGYLPKEEALEKNKHLEILEKPMKITDEPKLLNQWEHTKDKVEVDNRKLLPTYGNALIESEIKLPDSVKKVERPIRKRCRLCRKRGHIKNDCPNKQLYWNWRRDAFGRNEQGKDHCESEGLPN